jgi:hypothetical protein
VLAFVSLALTLTDLLAVVVGLVLVWSRSPCLTALIFTLALTA